MTEVTVTGPESEHLRSLLEAVKGLKNLPNVEKPSFDEIRSRAERFGGRTEWGNYNFVSSIKNRSAGLTVYIGPGAIMNRNWSARQKEIIAGFPQTLQQVLAYLKKAPFVYLFRNMGQNKSFVPHCHLYVSVHRPEMIRLAYMWGQTLFETGDQAPGPEQYLVYIPEWQEKDRQILVFPEINTTIVLGSDYYGESKMGHLRLGMWNAKQRGMLGLHAGSKVILARDHKSGKLKRYGMIIFGLTATGKTTHSCHTHGLAGEGEGIEILQDDVVFLAPDGSAFGTEKGFYLKTEGVSPVTQPLIYQAARSGDTVFENVMVDHLGRVDFDDSLLTGNGRGVMQRADLKPYVKSGVDLPPAKEVDGLLIAFIARRNTVVPICSKLTLEQGALAFMLGESIESSGSDPKRAGESVREVGMNPFIIGDYTEEGNIFYNILKKNPEKIQCYLLNTGGVGELTEVGADGKKIVKRKVLRVEIPEMASIIRGIARGNIEWQEEPHWGTLVPKKVEGVDMSKFDLSRFYSQAEIDRYVESLRKERIEYLERFQGLDPAIVEALTNTVKK